MAAEECVSLGADGGVIEVYANREVNLGLLPVSRALPIRDRRMVGPWCFLDRFGPLSFTQQKPMDVAPHPHTGLQTVTWLLEGEVVHDDSLGCEAIARPGGVNVMTAGRGIAHAEQTPSDHTGKLNGIQLWVAMPDSSRNAEPSFESREHVPQVELPGGLVKVFAGALVGETAPTTHYSPLCAAEILIHAGQDCEIGLDPTFEHALLSLDGDSHFQGQPLEPRKLYYLGTHRSSATFRSLHGARLLIIGGPPFPERILMWWNFLARTPEEIAQFKDDWEREQRFGPVKAYSGPRLAAPELIRFARPNPLS